MPKIAALLASDWRPVPASGPGTGRPSTEPRPALTPSTTVTANPALAVGQTRPRLLVAARLRFSAARALLRTGPCTPGSIRARAGWGSLRAAFGCLGSASGGLWRDQP